MRKLKYVMHLTLGLNMIYGHFILNRMKNLGIDECLWRYSLYISTGVALSFVFHTIYAKALDSNKFRVKISLGQIRSKFKVTGFIKKVV